MPSIGAVILLRPTRSLALFRQMIGRGARPSGRQKTIILDHAACVVEHGLPDEEYQWSLDGERPRRKREIEGGERTRMRRCPTCTAVHEWDDECPECGHEYSGPREVTEVSGHLKEVLGTPELVTLLEFAQMRNVGYNTVRYKWRDKGLPIKNGYVSLIPANDWVDDYYRALKKKQSENTKAQFTPEARAAQSARVKNFLASPKNAKAHRARIKAALNRPETKAKLSGAQIRRFSKPEERVAASLRKQGKPQSPESNAKRSEGLRRSWERPDRRSQKAIENYRAGQVARFSDPESLAEFREKMRIAKSKVKTLDP